MIFVRIKVIKFAWMFLVHTHSNNAINVGWIWVSWQGGEFLKILLSGDLVEWKKQKPKYELNAYRDLETSFSHVYTESGHVFQS